MNDVTIRVLNALFRGIPPSRLLDILVNQKDFFNESLQHDLMKRYCANNLMEFSLNEQEVILQQICQHAMRKSLECSKLPSTTTHLNLPIIAIYTALIIAEQSLDLQSGSLLCRVENLSVWREISLLLGQDIFSCAFLAWKDINSNYKRKDFTWQAVIPVDHRGLNSVLSKGLAENHQHLYGSSQTFALSWCSLMNHPETHEIVDKQFEELFTPFSVAGSKDKVLSPQEQIQYACLCRIFLFRWVKTHDHSAEDSEFFEFYKDLLHFPMKGTVKRKLCTLRSFYGARVPQPSRKPECLDYALEPSVFWVSPDAPFRILGGERALLYQCFRLFFTNRMSAQVQMAFYIYLTLKSMFRSEMIQVNQKVGFQNFSKYQDRKTFLCDRPCYEAELVRMAINAPLTQGTGNVVSLETRLQPKNSSDENRKIIRHIDSLMHFADLSCRKDLNFLPQTGKKVPKKNDQYFFVFHFIKRPDSNSMKLPNWHFQHRHAVLRHKVRQQAVSLARAISRSPDLCHRIRGIDAASNEVTCPPEVFANAFRFLRNFRSSDFVGTYPPYPLVHPRLSATYHVGEDFMDIASALRSIDETIKFLELARGDRLGHVLGLGVEPILHYKQKGYKIFQSKQERLDNLIWLTHRTRELGVHIDPHLYGELKKETEILLLQVYGNVLPVNSGIPLTEYYCAMQLRGDAPSLYASGRYERNYVSIHPYDEFNVLNVPDIHQYREHTMTAYLYYLYHFNQSVKRTGAEPVEVIINKPYMQLIHCVQDAMQEHISNIGLAIECNPSSNVLIGSFQSYAAHPIFRFNNAKLEHDSEERNKRSQLQVCVNTDDLGIFDTSQEFEYAMLFQALKNMYNEEGKRTYKEVDILSYLDSLRQIGLEVVFPGVSY